MALYDKLDDTSRGFTAAGGQLNIYDETLNKYVFFLPLETLPSVAGSTNTVENDVTTSNIVGKIKGKRTIDDKDINFLLTRDNVERLNEYANKTCKFMVSYPNYTGWKFVGEYTYRNDDATSSEKVTGTITFISSDVDETLTMDVQDLMAKTCFIESNLEDVVEIATTNGTYSIALQSNMVDATFSAESSNSTITATVLTNTLTISTTSTSETGGLVRVKASKTGFASWTYVIKVIVA